VTDDEKKAFELTKATVKKETEKISLSLTRILMLMGPKSVQAILASLTDTNEKMLKELKVDLSIEFKENGNAT
jgi:hypothetical protein